MSNIQLAKNDKLMELELRVADDGKIKAFLKETTAEGVKLPTRMAFVDKVDASGTSFMVVRAPIRELAEDGSFLIRARQKDGKFLDAQGKEVDSEEKAESQFVLKTQKNDPEKLVYAQIATLNIKNLKQDKTPTAMTMVTAKLWSDAEALDAERIAFRMSAVGKEHAEYAGMSDEIKAKRKATGSYADFFINKGHDALRAMGFEIRERVKQAATSEVQPG